MVIQTYKPTTNVIFDMGGTLIDVVSIIKNLFIEFALSIGKVSSEQFLGNVENCNTLEDLADEFSDTHQLNPKQKNDLKNEIVTMVINKIKSVGVDLCPGAQKLIDHLFENNIPMAIATNGPKAFTDLCLQNTKRLNLDKISHIVSGGDDPEVKYNKPAPDIFLVCADRFKNKPKSIENCVIFEDSYRGITGAVASGMKTVLINDMKSFDFSDICGKITEIVDSLENFKPESVGLPPYKAE